MRSLVLKAIAAVCLAGGCAVPVDDNDMAVLDMAVFERRPLADVRSDLAAIVDRVEHTHTRVVVTRRGRPAAVIIGVAELESLEDTIDLLSNREAMQGLEQARQAYVDRDYIGVDELRSRFGST